MRLQSQVHYQRLASEDFLSQIPRVFLFVSASSFFEFLSSATREPDFFFAQNSALAELKQ